MPWDLKKQQVVPDGSLVKLEFWAGADKNGLPLRVQAAEVSLELGPVAPPPTPPDVPQAILAAATATAMAELAVVDVQPAPGKFAALLRAMFPARTKP